MNPKIDKVLIQEDTKMNHAYTLTVQYGKRSSIRDVRTEGESGEAVWPNADKRGQWGRSIFTVLCGRGGHH